MASLDNPPDNPCFGCGPAHGRGLRLGFERVTADDGVDEVRCTYTPKEDEIGWPGMLHIGLHFLVAYEASYWGAWELSGHVAITRGPATFDQARLPRVGRPFMARARLAGPDPEPDAWPDHFRVEAWSEGLDGKPLARLSTRWRHARRGDVEKAGLKLPGYLIQDMLP